MIKLPIFVLMWALFLAIKIPVALLGPLVLPFMYKYREVEYLELPWWTRPWSNPEDWFGQANNYDSSLPKWWVLKKGIGFKSFWHYHAIRNPANGLRSYEWLDLDIVPELVKYKTGEYLHKYEPKYIRERNARMHYKLKTAWYFAWQGFRAGFKIVHIWSDKRHLVIKFGWRVQPNDALDVEKHSAILREDASFASKFLFYREG